MSHLFIVSVGKMCDFKGNGSAVAVVSLQFDFDWGTVVFVSVDCALLTSDMPFVGWFLDNFV